MEHVTSANTPQFERVRVRYWAGASHAAGVEGEELRVRVAGEPAPAAHVTGEALRAAVRAAHPGIDDVLRRCSLLCEGRRVHDTDVAPAASLVEVLPPFVGG